MAAKQRKEKQTRDAPVSQTSLDPNQLTKRRVSVESMHLNLRLSGESVHIYRYLEKYTPGITDSLRVRDCIRIAAFLIAMREKEEPVHLNVGGRKEDLLEHIGAFFPQTPMDTRRRTTEG